MVLPPTVTSEVAGGASKGVWLVPDSSITTSMGLRPVRIASSHSLG